MRKICLVSVFRGCTHSHSPPPPRDVLEDLALPATPFADTAVNVRYDAPCVTSLVSPPYVSLVGVLCVRYAWLKTEKNARTCV